MENVLLFLSKKGNVDKKNLYQTLLNIGANDCKYLFIHSSINFGLPNPDLKKKELLDHILDVIMSLNVENVLMPTFTFSFCNKEDFDIQNTKSAMGVLTEFFRKQHGVKRSSDPMMSVAMLGQDYSVIDEIGNISCGENCTFDLLHKKGGTKFLFLGNYLSDCMTYTHYVEVMKNVPYRYAKEFTGNIINNGISQEAKYYLHVRYKDIFPFCDRRIDELMIKNNGGKNIYLGDGVISIAEENKVFQLLSDAIDKNPDFMLSHKCPNPPFDDFYVYEKKVAL